jgi:hypothetical protein
MLPVNAKILRFAVYIDDRQTSHEWGLSFLFSKIKIIMNEKEHHKSETEISELKNNNTSKVVAFWQPSFLHVNAITIHLILYGSFRLLEYAWLTCKI